MRRVFGMATASVVVFLGLGVGTTLAQGIVSVPDNAVVLIKVNNLEKTSQKLGALMQQWGLAQAQPMLADPLAAVQAMGNLQQGINKSGEAAFVFMNPQAQAQQNQGGQPYVLMLPVSDYAAFLKNFPDAEAEGEVSAISMPLNQEPAYVAKWGDFAAISPTKGLVTARPQASKATGLAAKQLAESDIVAYVNFAGFRNQAAMGLGFGRMVVMGQVDQGANQNPDKAKYAPAAKAFVTQLFNGLDHFINETQAVTLAVNVSNEGLQITEMAEFAPESYLGKYVAQWKSPQVSYGKGLPEGSYALVGGSALDGKTAVQLIDDMLGPVMVEAKKLGPEAQSVVDYMDALKESLVATKSSGFGVSAGQGKAGETPLFDLNMVMEGDSQKIVAAQTKMGQSQDQFQKLLSAMQPANQPVTSMQLAKGAKKVNGVSFDQITTTVAGGDDNQRKMLDLIYGKGGMQMLFAPVDSDTVLLTTSKEEANIGKAITAARGNGDVLAGSAPTKQVASRLPANPIMGAYVYGDQLMVMASRASEAFAGIPLQMQIPGNQPPLAVSLSTEGTAVRFDIFAPSPLIKTIVQTVMQQAMKPRANPNANNPM